MEPPDSPVWAAAEPDVPGEASPRSDRVVSRSVDLYVGTCQLALWRAIAADQSNQVTPTREIRTPPREHGTDVLVETTRSWNAQGAGVEPLAPAGALPGWADGDSSSSDDEPDCHICRLTAEEKGEPLIVVCACTTMPVHHSCLEAWRVQCRNPASAHRCPTCHEQYRLPTSPRAISAGDDDNSEPQLIEDVNWSRLELMRRRLIFRAGGATWLPPREFGPSAFKSARLSLTAVVVWLLVAVVSMVMGWVGVFTDDDRIVQDIVFRTALYGTWCSTLSYVAARFKSWNVLRCYVFSAGLQIMLAMTSVLLWLMLNFLGWWPTGDKWVVVLVSVHSFCFFLAIATVVCLNDLNCELDPRRQRREYMRQRRQARNERRRREQQREAQANAEPAVAPPRGAIVGAAVPQSTGLSLRQFLGSLQMEAQHDTITGMGVSTVEQLSTLDEQACVAQGMLPLHVRRLKRVASEHLQQVARDQAVQGSVVGFTTANDPSFPRAAASGGGLSDGLLGEVV